MPNEEQFDDASFVRNRDQTRHGPSYFCQTLVLARRAAHLDGFPQLLGFKPVNDALIDLQQVTQLQEFMPPLQILVEGEPLFNGGQSFQHEVVIDLSGP